MTDFDPTINPTDDFPDYDPALTPGERLEDRATIQERPSIVDEYAKKPIAKEVPKKLLTAIADYAIAVQTYRAAEKLIAKLQAEYLSVLQREIEITRISELADTEITAWCADYTTYLLPGSTIATLEPPGEIDPPIGGGVNIAPAYTTSGVWTKDYGKIQYSATLSPSGFVWNFTMINPVQKWMPKWRYGTITAINTDRTVNIVLDPVISTAKVYLSAVDINAPYAPMTGVVVDYMNCHTTAFSVNDEVVVQFTKTLSGGLEFYEPKVIGFKHHPKQCRAVIGSSPQGQRAMTYGPINGWQAPLLTIYAGSVDWTNGLILLSWYVDTKYWEGITYERYKATHSTYPYVFLNGDMLCELPSGRGVFGAAATAANPQKIRVVASVISSNMLGFELYERNWRGYYENNDMMSIDNPDGWELISSYTAPYHLTQPFYFDANGSNAISVRAGRDAIDGTQQFAEVHLSETGVFSLVPPDDPPDGTVLGGVTIVTVAADYADNELRRAYYRKTATGPLDKLPEVPYSWFKHELVACGQTVYLQQDSVDFDVRHLISMDLRYNFLLLLDQSAYPTCLINAILDGQPHLIATINNATITVT